MESSNSESDQENEGQLMMPLYIREVVIEGVDKSQKRGGKNGVYKKQKVRLWSEGHSYREKSASKRFPGVLTFRCSRAKGCNGRGFTMRGMFHVTAEHNHDDKRDGGLSFEVQKRLHKGDRLATQLSTTPTET
uniref:FLYWCH-type domain-containing protein n=1 Tax=Ditylenchus dipsaci TaxID=166011 RepID=A0A915EGI5_9BILA